MKYNIIFACDECLDELVVPNEDFQPAMMWMYYQTWRIPETIMICEDGYREVPSSNFITKCP